MSTDEPGQIAATALIYVFDAYCGWSYGFAPTLIELSNRIPNLDLEVVSGGLFAGPRRTALATLGYIDEANARIAALTGVEFGAGYASLIEAGTFVMDSEGAATTVAAIRALSGRRLASALHELQRAFYVDGFDIADSATVTDIANRLGLEEDDLATELRIAASNGQAHRDFARAASLGVTTYPTLLVRHGGDITPVSSGLASLSDLEGAIAATHTS